MFVYKKLKASDIAVVPFNAHKQYDHTLKGYSDSVNHLYFITASWSQSATEQYEAANIGHTQLEHLFYEDYPSDLANKFGNVNFIKHHRQLDEEVYVYSIPQLNYGVEIKPKSLQLETITHVENFEDLTELQAGNTVELTARFIDDGLGNIFHLETAIGSGSQAFTPEFFPNAQKYNHKEIFKDDRIFYLNPINSYKYTKLTHDKKGKRIINVITHSIGPNASLPHFDATGCVIPTYSQEDVYDDSYYYGLIDYNNIRFSKYSYFPKYRNFDQSSISENDYGTYTDFTKITFMDFHHNGLGYHTINKKERNVDKRGGSYLQLPHNEKYNFNTTDDFAINFNLKPGCYNRDVGDDNDLEFHIIGKSLTRTVVASSLEGKSTEFLNTNISGSSQEVDIPSHRRYPFEVFLKEHVSAPAAPPAPQTSTNCGNKTHLLPGTQMTRFDLMQEISVNYKTSNLHSFTYEGNDPFGGLTPPLSPPWGTGTTTPCRGPIGAPLALHYLSHLQIPNGLFFHKWDDGSTNSFVGWIVDNGTFNVAGAQAGMSYLDWTNVVTTYEAMYNTSMPNWNPLNIHSTVCEGCAPAVAPPPPAACEYDLCFRRSDGYKTHTVVTPLLFDPSNESIYNITCQYEKNKTTEDLELSIWIDGSLQAKVIEDYPTGCSTCAKDAGITQNNANVYIGCQGGIKNFFTGSLQNISIYQRPLSEEEIIEHSYESKYIGTPIVGNIFYNMGLITITNPYYFNHFKHNNITSSIRYKNTMPLVENEIQCTIDEQEYNYTNNVTTRCIQNEEGEQLSNFATSSLWKPYVTTLGLYNESHELLVVGKLGQPTKMSDETDTTFVLRWDT